MDLNALRLFVATVQAGSISKAAERTGTPVPTISRKLIELEKELAIQLLDRSKTGVKPTALGLRLYEQVYLTMDALLQAENFGKERSELAGILRLSTVSASEEIWDWIGDFQVLHPKVQVYCQVTERLLDLVADGIDVAFRVGNLQADNIIAKPLQKNRVKLVAHPDLLAKFGEINRPEDLAHVPCAGWALAGQKQISWQIDGKVHQLDFALASNDGTPLIHWATQGKAVTMLNETTANRLIAESGLVEVLADYPKPDFDLHIIYLAHRHPSAVVKAFVEFCLQKAEEN